MKYSLLFVITLTVTCSLILGVISFLIIGELQSAPKGADHNLNAVLQIGKGYLAELSTFDSLYQNIQQKKLPPFCSTLCNPVSIDQSQLITERTPYLNSYYKANGAQSIKDPLFRFKLEQMLSVTNAVPNNLRKVMAEILDEGSTQNRVGLALKLEASLLSSLPSLPSLYAKFLDHSNKLILARSWMKACQSGANPQKITQECRSEFP